MAREEVCLMILTTSFIGQLLQGRGRESSKRKRETSLEQRDEKSRTFEEKNK